MDPLLLLLRIGHVGGAMIWFGGAIISSFFLDPTATALGKRGQPFMDYLMTRRRMGVFFPVVGIDHRPLRHRPLLARLERARRRLDHLTERPDVHDRRPGRDRLADRRVRPHRAERRRADRGPGRAGGVGPGAGRGPARAAGPGRSADAVGDADRPAAAPPGRPDDGRRALHPMTAATLRRASGRSGRRAGRPSPSSFRPSASASRRRSSSITFGGPATCRGPRSASTRTPGRSSISSGRRGSAASPGPSSSSASSTSSPAPCCGEVGVAAPGSGRR